MVQDKYLTKTELMDEVAALRQRVADLETQLREFDSIVEKIADHVLITNREGMIQYVNPAFERITGYILEEVQGKTPRVLKSGKHDLAFYERLWSTVLSGQVFRTVFINQRKDGELFYDDQTITPIMDGHNQVTHFISTGRDITVRIQQDRALRAQNENLVQLNADLQARNEELDAYAHTVAHDLKNPLSIISGYAELFSRGFDDLSPEDVQHGMKLIGQRANKMAQIINSLLLLASVRQSDLETEPLDMGAIVSEARERLAPLIVQSQAEIVSPESWPVVLGQAVWVEEVWANYLSNALKYGGTRPRIILGAEVLPNAMVRFFVQDHGSGLSPEAQTRLFRPFEQLGQSRQDGHGLGLSIVKRIVEKLDGEVGVACEVGQGCRFTFSLPVAPQGRS